MTETTHSRRAVVCALAAAPAVAAPVMALAAAADHVASFQAGLAATSSEKIARMHGLYRRLLEQIEVAEADLEQRYEAHVPAEKPRWQGRGPMGVTVPTYNERGEDGKWKTFLRTDAMSVSALERMASLDPDAVPRKETRHPADVAMARASRARTKKQAQEALHLVRAYKAEARRRQDADGITEADRKLVALHRQLNRTAAVIRSLPAVTYSDLAMQLDASFYYRQFWPALIDRLQHMAGVDPVHDLRSLEADTEAFA